MTDKIYFKVIEFRPDRREYQQNSVLMQTNMNVVVELPEDVPGLVDHYDDTEAANPVLTPAGMAWVMMQIENAILPKVQPATPIDEWVNECEGCTGRATVSVEEARQMIEESKLENERRERTQKITETNSEWTDEGSPEPESPWTDDDGWDQVTELKAKKAENTNSNWEEEWDK